MPALLAGPPSNAPAFNQPQAMQTALRECGLTNVQAIEDEYELMYADEDVWLAAQWSHGMRYLLEAADPTARDQLRPEAFAPLQAQHGSHESPGRLVGL